MYLFLDTETGGIGLDTSLLEIAFVLTTDKLEIVDKTEIFLVPDDEIYRVTPTGMAVNGIDLVELNKFAITYKDAKSFIYSQLQKWYLQNNSKRLVAVGKNIGGDLAQIWDKTISRKAWENFVDYATIDLNSIYQFLRSLNIFDTSFDTSLGGIAKYYGIEGNTHRAMGDALLTLEVFSKFRNEIGVYVPL